MSKKQSRGLSRKRLYWVWGAMLQRCYNVKNAGYKDYGKRGIGVCDEWRYGSKVFLEWALQNGYKQGCTIERIDNDKGYSPNNCLFVSRMINNSNKRVYRVSKTGFAGITPRGCKFRVRLRANWKLFNIGTFDTIEEAVLQRNSFIKTNGFPHKIQVIK